MNMMDVFYEAVILAIYSIASHRAHTSHAMQCSVVILLLISAATSDGLACITSEIQWKDLPSANLDLDGFMQTLKQLTTTQKVLDGPCRVEIILDYDDETLSIKFIEDLAGYELTLGEVRFDTLVLPLYKTFFVSNFLEYACAKGGCEMAFLKDHLPWLLRTSYGTLAKNALPLITRNTNGSSKKFIQLIAEPCLWRMPITSVCYSNLVFLTISDESFWCAKSFVVKRFKSRSGESIEKEFHMPTGMILHRSEQFFSHIKKCNIF